MSEQDWNPTGLDKASVIKVDTAQPVTVSGVDNVDGLGPGRYTDVSDGKTITRYVNEQIVSRIPVQVSIVQDDKP